MRLLLAGTMLIVTICCSTPAESPSETNPAKTAHRFTELDYQTALQQKIELRRLHRELRSRAILRGLGDRVNLRYLEEKFNVKTLPEFEGFSELEIQAKIKDIESQVTWEAMTYNDSGLEDVYDEVPQTTVPGVPHVRNSDIIKASRSVVAIIHKEYLKLQMDGTYQLITEPLITVGDRELCSFSDFYNAAHTMVAGTGFLVADSVIATAGHVYDNEPNIIGEYYFVFDYRMLSPFELKTTFTDMEVYEGKALMNYKNSDMNDWALILLQRKVEGRDPLEYRSSGKVSSDAKLYLLGHPFGLPMKYSGLGRVLNNIGCHFFTSNLDNYQYNSGSPVFDRGTNLVEGILCRDLGPDYENFCAWCQAPSIFRTQFGIPGVEITRSFMFASYLLRYEYITVRCSIEAGYVQEVSGLVHELALGEEKLIPYSELGISLLTNAGPDCWAPYAVNRGDIWEIKDGPDGLVVMVKVCE